MDPSSEVECEETYLVVNPMERVVPEAGEVDSADEVALYAL